MRYAQKFEDDSTAQMMDSWYSMPLATTCYLCCLRYLYGSGISEWKIGECSRATFIWLAPIWNLLILYLGFVEPISRLTTTQVEYRAPD